MRVLLDTHVLLWAVQNPERLSADVRDVLEDPDHEILFSVASIWEMAIKAALGRADFPAKPRRIVDAAISTGFVELPIHIAAALRVATLPHLHRDPFDRLLVAQAMEAPAMLYTADTQLEAYSELVVCI